MSETRLYGKNRKHPSRGARSYWTDIEAWKRRRKKATGRFPPTVNVTSQTRAWSRGLSPILIGPADTYAENGVMLQAVSVEVAWQQGIQPRIDRRQTDATRVSGCGRDAKPIVVCLAGPGLDQPGIPLESPRFQEEQTPCKAGVP